MNFPRMSLMLASVSVCMSLLSSHVQAQEAPPDDLETAFGNPMGCFVTSTVLSAKCCHHSPRTFETATSNFCLRNGTASNSWPSSIR